MFAFVIFLFGAAFAQYLECFPANPADVTCDIFVENGTPGCADSEIVVSWTPDYSERNCTVLTAGANTFYIKVVKDLVVDEFAWYLTPDECMTTGYPSYSCVEYGRCVGSTSGDYGSGVTILPGIRCDGPTSSGTTTSTSTGDSSSNPPPSRASSSSASIENLFV